MHRQLRATIRPVTLETRVGSDYPYAVGYAAVFYNAGDMGTQYQLTDYGEGMVERIMPWAFDRAIRDQDDCRACFNHDANLLLGRLGAGTLELSTDKVGLRYAVQLPDTQAGRDCRALLERGDVTGSSFSFAIDKQKFVEQKGAPVIREIHSVRLFDVGPATYPAYQSTTAGLRAIGGEEEIRQALADWRLIQEKDQAVRAALKAQVETRGRCVELGL